MGISPVTPKWAAVWRTRSGRPGSISSVKYRPVGTGVGYQLLFIKGLGVIEGLLRRIAQQSVGIPLERCQVIESGRMFGFLLSFVFCRTASLAFRHSASKRPQPGDLSLNRLLGCHITSCLNLNQIEQFRPERINGRFPAPPSWLRQGVITRPTFRGTDRAGTKKAGSR